MSSLQQINLYRPEFQKEIDPFRFTTMLIAWGLVVVFYATIQMWVWNQTQNSREQLAAMEIQQAKVLQQLQSLRDSTPRNRNAQMDTAIAVLKAEVVERRQLLQLMRGQDVGNTDGFSDYLISLSRQHMDGLALEHFNLMKGGDYVELSGWTYKPELVPDYLQRLRKESSFQDTRFGDMAIERVTRQQTTALRFNLGEEEKGGS